MNFMCGRQWGSLFEDNSSSSKAKWNTATAPCTNLVVLRCCCGGAEVRHCFQPGRTLWFHCYCCVCGDSKHLSSTFRTSDKVSYVVSMMVYRTTVVMMLVKPMSLLCLCVCMLYIDMAVLWWLKVGTLDLRAMWVPVAMPTLAYQMFLAVMIQSVVCFVLFVLH